jgi:hypothetical protein
METERRKYPRFSVRDNVFAVFQPEPVKLVPILDIGLGGLAIGVRGIHAGDKWLNSASGLEILIDDCSFYMDNLPYRLLSKYRSLSQNGAGSFENIYGLKFLDLMSSQKSQLKYFIRNHTVGGMTPQFIRKFNQRFHQFLDQKDYGAACRNISFQRPSP